MTAPCTECRHYKKGHIYGKCMDPAVESRWTDYENGDVHVDHPFVHHKRPGENCFRFIQKPTLIQRLKEVFQ